MVVRGFGGSRVWLFVWYGSLVGASVVVFGSLFWLGVVGGEERWYNMQKRESDKRQET
jgi:hypothetical protein